MLAFTYSPSLASCSAPLKLYLLIQTILGAGVLLSFLFGWAIRHSRLRLAAIISLSLLLFGLVIMMGLGLVWLSRREGYCVCPSSTITHSRRSFVVVLIILVSLSLSLSCACADRTHASKA